MPEGYNHLSIENNNGQANNGSLVHQSSAKMEEILETCVQMLKEQLAIIQQENKTLRMELKAKTEELEKVKQPSTVGSFSK